MMPSASQAMRTRPFCSCGLSSILASACCVRTPPTHDLLYFTSFRKQHVVRNHSQCGNIWHLQKVYLQQTTCIMVYLSWRSGILWAARHNAESPAEGEGMPCFTWTDHKHPKYTSEFHVHFQYTDRIKSYATPRMDA